MTRFGWKAQNKSLYLFCGEATNVEMGITNEIFPNEKAPGTNCAANQLPEDETNTVISDRPKAAAMWTPLSRPLLRISRRFMRFNGAPSQCDFASGVDASGNAVCNPLSASAQNGLSVFNAIGCNVCHTQSFTTQPSNVEGLSNRTFQPFSDFALHHMGVDAGRWRHTRPRRPGPVPHGATLGTRAASVLPARWPDVRPQAGDSGSCQRCQAFAYTTAATQVFTVTFPLNNNATAHFTPASATLSCGSDANEVIDQFKRLSISQQQDLLNFLRSL